MEDFFFTFTYIYSSLYNFWEEGGPVGSYNNLNIACKNLTENNPIFINNWIAEVLNKIIKWA